MKYTLGYYKNNPLITYTMDKKRIIEALRNIPTMGKITLILAILLLISMFAFTWKTKEGFTQSSEFLLREGPQVYDSFYASIYDALVFDEIKNDYEIGEIINQTSPTEESVILDIGSGTGHHVGSLSKAGYNTFGLELSKAMIDEARTNYPDAKFIRGDVMDAMVVPPESVTHVTCLYMTIYNIEDKRRFFQNCMSWLMPGGYLALHLVNRERFDPILPAGRPLDLISVQDYAKERLTETRVKFKDFVYKGKFDINPNDLATYKEIFIDDKTKKVRQHNHVYYMETQKQILQMAKDAGFIMVAQVDLMNAGYDYQYVYILQKPN